MTKKAVIVTSVILFLLLAAGAVLLIRRPAAGFTLEEKLQKSPTRQVGPKVTTFGEAAQGFYGDSKYWLVLCRANPGTSSLAGGQAIHVPAQDLADAYLQKIAALKRAINESVDPMAFYHGFPEVPFEYTPPNAPDEAWLAAADSWPSPDGRFTLYEERRFRVHGRRWVLYLVMKDSRGKMRGAPLGGVSSGSVGDAKAYWLDDSSKAVVKIPTGYDNPGELTGLGGPQTPLAYFVIDTSKAPEVIAVTVVQAKADVGDQKLKDLLHLDKARLKKAVDAVQIDTMTVKLPEGSHSQR